MAELPSTTITATITNHNDSERIEFSLFQNYSVLINKLEQLALGVDVTLTNISLDYKQDTSFTHDDETIADSSGSQLYPQTHVTHTYVDEVEYSRVVSDIWVGVILTLLIVSVIFLICAGFLYHKFQKWKNSYRSDATDPVETCRNYPPNYEMESLPSYTIVSGLPTYDDALEQFRKAGIILAPPMPIIKIFEAKDTRKMYSIENGVNENDNLSITNSNACTCTNSAPVTPPPALPSSSSNAPLIELSPEQLAQLSQKRLSLQIAFGSQMHRNSRPRINMHNQLLLSRAISNADALEQGPQIHRSYSSSSFSTANNSN
ncbi:uncharacterized protein LOC119644426 [Glossina fuscipes]|uniref:Uncharacterized protein LOC119644420 n=1 Tax=Glossina fuscipes TaxID=7396 RepID=A0A9C5ZND0_9MUSC|nr:uncharacterized protein LOC119644420 [Glossina fuscipes]XP_037899895.1 uncharacterized protein LOC119644420 [Glossina fuscipes]XP_037899896.1 uncharacterized protein LOC119644420 [Glossina fuscipes]XP_037899901.1 uncharacterized protein LOC119644426 [Glossina fuscipes]XP_037899903.1 uncharacterized protein LOC119644426 [Glossina fuscipes]XP_037899904.1 uncharacterized protein LOC119644426 [Glossina fuscipes]